MRCGTYASRTRTFSSRRSSRRTSTGRWASPDALVAPDADWGITASDPTYAEVLRDPAWRALHDELRGEPFVRFILGAFADDLRDSAASSIRMRRALATCCAAPVLDTQRSRGVGDPGLEPGTSSLSEKRSNRLS